MNVERRRRSVPIRFPLLAALLLALAACDGGIFGTGDGSDTVTTSPNGSLSPPTGGEGEIDGIDDLGEGGTGESDSDTGGDGGADGGDGSVPTSALSNTLDVGAGTVPRVRLVNASALRVELVDAGGSPLSGSGVPSGASGTLVELPPMLDELRLRRAQESGEESLLYRLVPVTLSMSSVTTLIVRDVGASGEPSRGVDVVALETLLAPSDPAQALVRVVQGGMTNDPDEEAERRYRLVPDGASPGGVEVEFEGVSFEDDPATRYRDVPAGDYRFEVGGPDGAEAVPAPRPVSIAPGSVHTFVIVDAESVIDVIDGTSAKR